MAVEVLSRPLLVPAVVLPDIELSMAVGIEL